MRKKNKLVYGVGINDADYDVTKNQIVNGKWTQVWKCPFYWNWKSVIGRCYSEKVKKKQPTYLNSYAVPEWHYFMTFRAWMIQQDWEGKHLDKDILFFGNKVYGPDTCVFVDQKTNKFVNEIQKLKGELPIGVCSYRDKFMAQCGGGEQNKQKYLGIYSTAEEAHQAWSTFKLEQAYILAAEQTDPRVAKALIDRYENYAKFD